MGGFKKKGTFGRGNVRKRAASDEEDEDAAAPSDAPAAVAPAEKR